MKNDVIVDALQITDGGVGAGIEGKTCTGISKQKSARRKNFEDTDDNATDFEIVEYQGMSEADIQKYYPRSSNDGPWQQVTSETPLIPGEP